MGFLSGIAPTGERKATEAEGRDIAQFKSTDPFANQQTQATPPPPGLDNPANQKDLEEARRRQRLSRGRASTILTGGAGLEGSPNVSRRVLLGA